MNRFKLRHAVSEYVRTESPDAPDTRVDPYAEQRAAALEWLGADYLLHKPVNRKTEHV